MNCYDINCVCVGYNETNKGRNVTGLKAKVKVDVFAVYTMKAYDEQEVQLHSNISHGTIRRR
jgi:hypothetical protein